MKFLSFKTALLALTFAKCVGDLHAFSGQFTPDGFKAASKCVVSA